MLPLFYDPRGGKNKGLESVLIDAIHQGHLTGEFIAEHGKDPLPVLSCLIRLAHEQPYSVIQEDNKISPYELAFSFCEAIGLPRHGAAVMIERAEVFLEGLTLYQLSMNEKQYYEMLESTVSSLNRAVVLCQDSPARLLTLDGRRLPISDITAACEFIEKAKALPRCEAVPYLRMAREKLQGTDSI